MWKHYFGEKVKVYGVDINPACLKLAEENIEIFIGSQDDRDFLRELKAKLPPVDIVIDDGGHMMQQQIVTFEELYGLVKPDGFYVCEDLLTSYQVDYEGGYRRRDTFIEYSKSLIDQLNAWHSEQTRWLKVNEFTRSTFALHHFDSMLVIEKRAMSAPVVLCNGTKSNDEDWPWPRVSRWQALKREIRRTVNKYLAN